MIEIPERTAVEQMMLKALIAKYRSWIKEIAKSMVVQAEKGKSSVLVETQTNQQAEDIARIFNEAKYSANVSFADERVVIIRW